MPRPPQPHRPLWPSRSTLALCGLLAAACGGGGDGGGTPTPTAPAAVATVSVTPATAQVVAGQTVPLTATPRDAAGVALSGRAASWSSGATAVASVDGSGVVTGVTAGTATITATVGGVSGSAIVTVTPVPVATVTLAPVTVSIEAGASGSITATARDAAGSALTDRPVTWATSSTAVATVAGSGLSATFTGGTPGTATISATIGGVTATAAVTVTATPAALEVTGGSGQQGLLGRPLADSLTVRVRSASGVAVPGATVAWSATGGTLSSASTTTNAAGVARVQFSPGAPTASATATVAGLTPATFAATARAGGPCTLTPAAATQRFSLGPTDFTLSLRAGNALRAAVLFVDYPGLVATETPASLLSSVMDPGHAMLREVSYDRINLTLVPFPTWYRMPKAISEYDWTTYLGHRAFLLDVLSITDASIDFSSFDAIYVFSPPSANKPISPTFNGGTTANVMADGRNFGNAVTFGTDSRSHGPAIMAHETLHMLGLVDLYAFGGAPTVPAYPTDQTRFVGAWTLMSNVFVPGHILTWEKRKLGWIDESQVDCLDGPGGVEAVLTPNRVAGGHKLVAVPIDASSILVLEARDNTGIDGNLCATGLLLYEVDARIPTGQGPARILGSRATTSGSLFNRCGPWADGTFGFGASPVLTYSHVPTATQVTVVANEANGAVRVRVRR